MIVLAAWWKTSLLVLIVLPPLAAAEERAEKLARSVILMVADGAGYNTWVAASMYEGKWDASTGRSRQVYDGPGWVHFGCATYPLTLSKAPSGKNRQSADVVYDPAKAWDAVPMLSLTGRTFRGYQWLGNTATDSAAAGTALATGVKTYNRAINWTDDDRPLAGRTLAEIAKARGKAVGVVTTVQWSHATPACLGGAHHRKRDAYVEIANEMLEAGQLDVIFGAGNPDFDNSGRPNKHGKEPGLEEALAAAAEAKKTSDSAKPATGKKEEEEKEKETLPLPGGIARYVGGAETWRKLKRGEHPAGWRLVQSKAEFEALARGEAPKGKVLGTAEAYATLQQARGKHRRGDSPYSQPLNPNVPDLATMVQGALRVVAQDPGGFYLAIEGGAVDWANHNNQPARMIEEQLDFLRAVEVVVDWVEKHSSWDETLLVLTADHDCGLPWGPDSDKSAFSPLVDRGKGELPGLKYNSKSHTNSLVPLYAKGAGADRFASLAHRVDPAAAKRWGLSGGYVDSTDVFTVVNAAMQGSAK
jgi:alkaline phosphatase